MVCWSSSTPRELAPAVCGERGCGAQAAQRHTCVKRFRKDFGSPLRPPQNTLPQPTSGLFKQTLAGPLSIVASQTTFLVSRTSLWTARSRVGVPCPQPRRTLLAHISTRSHHTSRRSPIYSRRDARVPDPQKNVCFLLFAALFSCISHAHRLTVWF